MDKIEMLKKVLENIENLTEMINGFLSELDDHKLVELIESMDERHYDLNLYAAHRVDILYGSDYEELLKNNESTKYPENIMREILTKLKAQLV